MLYTLQRLSLACVEVPLHLDKGQLPRDYVWSKAALSSRAGFLAFSDLNDIGSCQSAGDKWVHTSVELAIQVPSVIIPEEFNILLNPHHEDYATFVMELIPNRSDLIVACS